MKEKEKRDHYPIQMITEKTALIIDSNGNKSNNPEGPLDSMEEWYFTCYLKELQETGVIKFAYKNEIPIELSSKVEHVFTEKMKSKDKIRSKHILHKHVYTPDFYISWNPDWVNLFFDRFNQGIQKKGHKIPFLTTPGPEDASMIEVKGEFIQGTQDALVNTNIKWTYEMRNIFVQKVKVPDIFQETFTPAEYVKDMVYKRANSKKKIKAGDSKIKFKTLTVTEYLDKIKLLGSFQEKMM